MDKTGSYGNGYSLDLRRLLLGLRRLLAAGPATATENQQTRRLRDLLYRVPTPLYLQLICCVPVDLWQHLLLLRRWGHQRRRSGRRLSYRARMDSYYRELQELCFHKRLYWQVIIDMEALMARNEEKLRRMDELLVERSELKQKLERVNAKLEMYRRMRPINAE